MFTYDTVVIVSSLNAFLYAFIHNCPIFFAEERRPFRFAYFSPELDLSALKIPTCNKSLTTFDGVKLIGQPKELLWERLFFLLSLDGKVPLSNLCNNIRYDGERMVCSNEYSKILECGFRECVYFGDENSTGFTSQKGLDEDIYICYDHIAFNSGGKHEIDYIETTDNFVREIWFYPSDRIDGNTSVKDACAVSVLNKKQFLNFDYSQTMARFKTIHEMESRGMKGTFAHDYTTAGNPKHYKFRTTSLYRETREQSNESLPQATNIKIPQIREQDLLQDLPAACMAYDRFLRYW